jgi:hypothetical protein
VTVKASYVSSGTQDRPPQTKLGSY